MSRRNFIKTALGLGVMGGTAGLALDLTASPLEAAVRKLPTKWDEQVDVVIVGSGFAGLAAAAEAASRRKKAIILEKMPVTGGNSTINGGGFCAWDDKLHLRAKLNRGDDSAMLHLKDTLAGGDYFGFEELIRVLVDKAPEALNWMIDEGGLEFRPVLNRIGGHSAYRGHVSIDGTGMPYVAAPRKIALRHGAAIRTGQTVSWIWRKDTDSPVLGVEVETPKGKKNIRAAGAVILASGGFGRDVKMRMLFNPSLIADYNCTNQPGATGEVIRFAQAVGADSLHLAFIQLYPTAEPQTGLLDAYALYPSRGPGNGAVFVNKAGKRFVSELERRDVVSRAEINTGSKPAYTICTGEMITKMTTKEEVDGGVKKGRVWRAESLPELAKAMGLPADAVIETVEKHNSYISEKKDPQFNKPITPQMIAMTQGPFYGVAQWPAIHHCMGGLRINTNAQALDIWGKPIPHLYAAGEVTGGIHGNNRLGGNATADCVVFGRIAGVNAAKEKT